MRLSARVASACGGVAGGIIGLAGAFVAGAEPTWTRQFPSGASFGPDTLEYYAWLLFITSLLGIAGSLLAFKRPKVSGGILLGAGAVGLLAGIGLAGEYLYPGEEGFIGLIAWLIIGVSGAFSLLNSILRQAA